MYVIRYILILTLSRVISTETRSLEESLTLLLAQVMDIVTTATNRVYLAADVLNNALEFLYSLLHLLPTAGLTECPTGHYNTYIWHNVYTCNTMSFVICTLQEACTQ